MGQDAAPKWFGDSNIDLGAWAQLFRDSRHPEPDKKYYALSDLKKDDRFNTLPSITGPPFLKFFAAVPIYSRLEISLGSVIVLDTADRGPFSAQQISLLERTAEKCMSQLEMAREAEAGKRVIGLNEGLNSFMISQAENAEQLQEFQPFQHSPSTENSQKIDVVGCSSSSSPVNQEEPGDEPASGAPEHTDLASEYVKPCEASAAQHHKTTASTATEEPQLESSINNAETPYRKIFRRAAEQLQTSLNVDGVVFVDGFVGFHGELLPTGEPEQELERELVQSPKLALSPRKEIEEENTFTKPEARIATSTSSQEENTAAHRNFTSAEFQAEILKKRPAEILGMSVSQVNNLPRTEMLSKSTKGLIAVDEGFLQIFLERYADGRIWYFDNGRPFYFENDVLVEDGPNSNAAQAAGAFPGIKQLIFAPLTDLTTLKRLAGCFAWTTQPFPVFTDVVDLVPYKAFLHAIEAEISRLDSFLALKQRESFVSSVSHELRTPLHGVLGALEFLEETNLDTFQRSLTHTIHSCGSTLHETLSNVLSYARINETERRKNKPNQGRPQNSPWALLNKDEHTSTDEEFQSPRVATNLATLCEEIMEVIESGRSFRGSANNDDLVLTMDIAYLENWNFITEPEALRRVIMNITGNALKYTTKGFVNVTLDIKDLKKNDKASDNSDTRKKLVTFTVKDSGRGMQSDFIQNHLFVPFTQESAGASDGVGLGMSIVKSLIALLGARINVKSLVGKGTEIEVTLPMERGKCASKEAFLAPGLLDQTVSGLRKQQLTVAVHGLAPVVDQSLQRYLVDWFNAKVVRVEELADHLESHADILIIDERVTDDTQIMSRLAKVYGQHIALLSVSNVQKRNQNLAAVQESFAVWERAYQPLGPRKISQALQKCLHHLDSLSATAKGSSQARPSNFGKSSGPSSPRQELGRNNDQNQTHPKKAKSVPSSMQLSLKPVILSTSTSDERIEKSSDGAAEKLRKPVSSAETSSRGRKPSILLVDDNVVNLKLLHTFVTKYGAEDIARAENGMDAVNAVKARAKGFDIIFMGKLDFASLSILSNVTCIQHSRARYFNPPASTTARQHWLTEFNVWLTITRSFYASHERLRSNTCHPSAGAREHEAVLYHFDKSGRIFRAGSKPPSAHSSSYGVGKYKV
jgi:signal transduction histidine kinase